MFTRKISEWRLFPLQRSIDADNRASSKFFRVTNFRCIGAPIDEAFGQPSMKRVESEQYKNCQPPECVQTTSADSCRSRCSSTRPPRCRATFFDSQASSLSKRPVYGHRFTGPFFSIELILGLPPQTVNVTLDTTSLSTIVYSKTVDCYGEDISKLRVCNEKRRGYNKRWGAAATRRASTFAAAFSSSTSFKPIVSDVRLTTPLGSVVAALGSESFAVRAAMRASV